MSLRFRYRLDRVNHPVLPLGGRWVRPRPVVLVTLIGPLQSRLVRALLDTASDDTVFPETWATVLGLDLTQAPQGEGAGVGMTAVSLRYAEVILRLTDHIEQREWKAWIGFTSARLPYPTLGFAGCLQFFTTSFHGDREEVDLTVNRLYPGT